jgi:hypothetical protein
MNQFKAEFSRKSAHTNTFATEVMLTMIDSAISNDNNRHLEPLRFAREW